MKDQKVRIELLKIAQSSVYSNDQVVNMYVNLKMNQFSTEDALKCLKENRYFEYLAFKRL